jgi:two-component system sensor histidine kinase KdpD
MSAVRVRHRPPVVSITGTSFQRLQVRMSNLGKPAPGNWFTRFWPYAASSLLVVLAGFAGLAVKAWIDPPNISMVFLAAVLISAMRYGLGPSLYASVLSTLGYNLFFLDPLFSLTIADPANIVALVFLLAAAMLTSDLTARLRRQVTETRQQAAVTEALHEFSHKLAALLSRDDLLWAVVHQLASMLQAQALVLLPDNGNLRVVAAYPPEDSLPIAEGDAAELAWRGGRPAGRDQEYGGLGGKYLFLPLRSADGPIGVVGVGRLQSNAVPMFTPDEHRLLSALVDQAAVAIARSSLAERADEVRLAQATEQLRLALLSAISHDFRTPLSAIIGSISSLRLLGEKFDRQTREALLDTIREEAERLNRFVDNVLDMTRLESGALRPNLLPVDLVETLSTVIGDIAPHLAQHHIDLELDADLPLVRLDPILLRHVIANLLDNAAKFSPAGSSITVSGQRNFDGVTLSVADSGPGIQPDKLDSIFERFTRGNRDDRRRAGSGLGLAICRGFLVAMNANIDAANRAEQSGAVFRIYLPNAILLDEQTIQESGR